MVWAVVIGGAWVGGGGARVRVKGFSPSFLYLWFCLKVLILCVLYFSCTVEDLCSFFYYDLGVFLLRTRTDCSLRNLV